MPDRRAFLAQLATAAVVAPAQRFPLRVAAAPRLALPSPAQRAWQDLEVGMFVHFAPNTWQDKEYDDRSTPLARITPAIDTEQWADTAVALGARYVVLVAKHVGGFCLWQTDTTTYGIRGTPWKGGKGDVMADLARSCDRRGLKLGVYLSPRDDSQAAGLAGKCATRDAQARYDVLYRRQLTEVLTRYGAITELWLDGSSVVPTGDLVARYAPNAMVFQGPQATIRWVGNEDGFAPYPCWNALALADAKTGIATALHGDPEGDAWMPVEVDVSIRRPNWFWSTTNEKNLVSLAALVEIYYRSVGRGAQLLLNLPPDRSGRIPAADAARAKELGDEIRSRFGTSLVETRGPGRRLQLDFPGPYRVDHVVLQEDLAHGERVRGYRLEALTGNGWVVLGEGSSIGHKRIHPVGPATVRGVRFTVTAAADEPVIRRFALFDTRATAPVTWNAPASLWADDATGSWSGGVFRVDVTDKLRGAGRYRLRFVPEGGGAVEVTGVELLVGGSAQARAVGYSAGRKDVLTVTVSASNQRTVVRGTLRGPGKGTVLLQRLP